VLREASLRHNISFWNFFNTMPYGGHSDPTESQLAWQIFTSLAYGAKGILYFWYAQFILTPRSQLPHACTHRRL
jgi:hypothetical protein